MTLGADKTTSLKVALHEDEPVRVQLALAELDISPLKSEQLALPDSSP
jgi:hypothetical protein